MNKYEIRVNNATIISEVVGSEYSAIVNLCLFGSTPTLLETVILEDEERPEYRHAWIYQVEVNKKITLAFVKRIG